MIGMRGSESAFLVLSLSSVLGPLILSSDGLTWRFTRDMMTSLYSDKLSLE